MRLSAAVWTPLWLGLTLTGAALALDVKEVERLVEEHPEADWIVRDSGIQEQFEGLGKQGVSPFGLREGEVPDIEVDPEDFKTPESLPARIDWRNHQGADWMGPVRNQGRCGSCVAFAAVAALEGQFNITGGASHINPDFSEQHLFARIGTCDNGSWPSSAMSALQSTGVTDEACFPYTSGRLGQDVPTSKACSTVSQRLTKIASYQSVSASSLKAALQNGPVVTTMDVYEDFMVYGGGVYRRVSNKYQGGHAVTIVGYDDSQSAWIVKNSWGSDWGERGYFRIHYQDTSGLGRSNHAIRLNRPNAFVKTLAPADRQVVSGRMTLKLSRIDRTPLRRAQYALLDANGRVVAQGDYSLDRLEAVVDTTALADGVYQLRVVSTAEDGRTGYPWYTRVHVVNSRPQVTLRLDTEFNRERPVTGRVFFRLKTQAPVVPLTDAIVEIKATDGSLERMLAVEDPGEDTKVSWRSERFPNGTYEVRAIGAIGDLHQFASPAYTVAVSN